MATSEQAYAGAVAVPTRQVEQVLEKLQAQVDYAYDRASLLESRLGSIIRAEDESASTGEPEMVLVPLAENLRRVERQAAATARRLDSILDRLEV